MLWRIGVAWCEFAGQNQVWTLECSEMRNFSHGPAFPVWRIYEWKSMEQKVQCDRPFSPCIGHCSFSKGREQGTEPLVAIHKLNC